MRTLKYAILGLLYRKPMTGYDILLEFEKGLSDFWNAKHSQIYPELKKLAEENMVRFETVIQGERMEKKLYSLTELGERDFIQWISFDAPLEPTAKDVFRLRVYLLDAMSTLQMKKQMSLQAEKRRGKLKFLQERLDEIGKTKELSALNKAERGDYLVLYSAVLRERSYLEWLEYSQNFLEQYDD